MSNIHIVGYSADVALSIRVTVSAAIRELRKTGVVTTIIPAEVQTCSFPHMPAPYLVVHSTTVVEASDIANAIHVALPEEDIEIHVVACFIEGIKPKTH